VNAGDNSGLLKRILLTGATGFIGSEVARLAVSQDLWVRGLGRRPVRGNASEIIVADLQSRDALRGSMAAIDCVIHAAGLAHTRKPLWDEWYAANVSATANLVSEAVDSGVPHFVLVSSVSVYGPNGGGLRDESAQCTPEDGYARSKFLAENAAIELTQGTNTALTILRLGTVYGEGDRGNIARFIRAIDSRRFLWIGSGDNRKSFIYKTDVARAILVAAQQNPLVPAIYNVTTEPCTVREIVLAICDALHKPPPRVGIPAVVVQSAANAMTAVTRGKGRLGRLSTDVRKLLADDAYDGSKFNAAFQFRDEVPLSEGVRREAAWLLGPKVKMPCS
jgi:nucleoside-diphosphate-sugar epimerase